jgi:hypothetical protein
VEGDLEEGLFSDKATIDQMAGVQDGDTTNVYSFTT